VARRTRQSMLRRLRPNFLAYVLHAA